MGLASIAARRRPVLRAVGIVLLAFALGGIDAAVRSPAGTVLERVAEQVPHCRVLGSALETEGGLGTLVVVERLSCGDRAVHGAGGLVFVEEPLTAGATIDAEGWLVPLSDDGFGGARRRFGAAAQLSIQHVIVRGPRSGLLGLAASVRAGLHSATRAMPSDRAALLVGVTTGETADFGEETLSDFRRSGLSHLVAVSGENVVMVLAALALVTRRLAAHVRALCATGLLALFVLVVGPQPSVLRAAAMAVVAIAAIAYGLRPEPWHALALGLIAVVVLRPAILFSAALHLSAAATAGILLWARPLARRLPLPSWIAAGLAVTLSAQIATAPSIVGLFGQVSLAGPVANLLALPAVPPATVLGLCAAAIGTASPRVGAVVARLAEPFVAWVLFVARAFGRPAWATFSVRPGVAWWMGAAVVTAAVFTAACAGRRDVRVGS
jgi:competence protein ComEC